MNKQQKEFSREVARLLPVLLREVTRRQKEFFSGDIPITHIVVMDYLRQNGPSRMSDLSEALEMTLSAVTNIIDKMRDSGLVERKRSKQDRRVVKVYLEKTGKKKAEVVEQERQKMARDVFAGLQPKEQKEYLRLLKKVCQNLTGENEEK